MPEEKRPINRPATPKPRPQRPTRPEQPTQPPRPEQPPKPEK